ncbi:hypothetical protein GJR88_00383 [Dietzia sp. DQ12-45-1b]|uniref:acyl-[acyl-carrier-protein] thioesterase n=2 Tax=Dietzia TaxID=37914 RepID=UPI001317235B|nr:hypothetical protein GJR88_00383 [Dietzia sp. DQ12-45-1b]
MGDTGILGERTTPMNHPEQDGDLRPLPPPPPDGAGFSTSRTVRTGEVDPRRRVRLDSIARYLQDAAGDDLEFTGHVRTDPYWIVRRTVIDVIEPITWPATVHLERWCSGLSTRWANMRVRLTAEHRAGPDDPGPRPDGLVETEAFWINVSADGVPARISDEGLASLSAATGIHRLRWAAMNAPLPTGSATRDLPEDRPHILRSTDFDILQHLNNAAYLDAVEDELLGHQDLLRHRHRVVIEYSHPVVPGSSMMIRRRRSAHRVEMWMLVDDRVVASVSVTGGSG